MTRRAGVIGSPARHSLSPTIHTAWLKAAGLNGDYGLYDIAEAEFEATVEKLIGLGLVGLNVTVPFKDRALALATAADPAASQAGAANVLLFRSGAVEAFNTDGVGVRFALAPFFGDAPKGKTFVVLGAGGAAAGAAFALKSLEDCQVHMVNRTPERAQALAERFGAPVFGHGWPDLAGLLPRADGLINATSMGLEGRNPLVIDLTGLDPAAPVMDMVYKPLETEFLLAARRRGHPTIDGLDMLIGQARPSFELFFGQKPDPGVDVRALCLAELERRAR
ncbi:MAG: aroE [Caulobacteraceae bacterium]|nr:aroE [Caulobacteraceae bacterium]